VIRPGVNSNGCPGYASRARRSIRSIIRVANILEAVTTGLAIEILLGKTIEVFVCQSDKV